MKIQLSVSLHQETIDKWRDLAERRYGDSSQESLDRVAEDAYKWLLERWHNGDYTFYDLFWTKLAYHCPFKRLAAIARAKLIFERYLE